MKFIPKLLTISALSIVTAQAAYAATHTFSGDGSLVGQTGTPSFVNSAYSYSGEGTLVGNDFSGDLIQGITGVLAPSNIFTTFNFDITTGLGSSTVTACTGASLVCNPILPTIGTPAAISAYDTGTITGDFATAASWSQIFVVDTGYGLADSNSTIIATANAVPVPAAAWLFGSALLGLAGIKRKKMA
ncbi:MAG: VPLPA-CTERM sorting domain-containing protein [Halioglobus sp.]